LRAADAAAAAGRHVAPRALVREVPTGRDPFGHDFLPIALELFGDELGEAGERPLPHLRTRDADHAGVVGPDDDPGIDLVAPGRALRGAFADAERQMESEREPAASGSGANDELAARKGHGFVAGCRVHGGPPRT